MGIIYSTLAALKALWAPKSEPEIVEYFRIPDILANWPWPRAINPHYEECRAESDAWIQGFDFLSPEAQAAFNKCEFGKPYPYILSSRTSAYKGLIGLLGSLGYPKLNKGISIVLTRSCSSL